MEIQWGDFYIKLEKTVAMLLVIMPVMALMYIPKVYGMICSALDRIKGRLAIKFPGHYAEHKDVAENAKPTK